MTENCPKCQSEFVLQKAPLNFSRPLMVSCHKCQTTLFFKDEVELDSKFGKRDYAHKPKILIVDDDTDILQIVEMEFLEAGFETMMATNGEEGFARLMEEIPDAVVLDIYLPTMDGWELSRKIKAQEELQQLPIVLVTGIYTGPEFKAQALEIGVDAFLTKPYSNQVLINILNKYILKTNSIPTD